MKEHNKNFYSIEELKRIRDSLEGYLDNEEVYYFVGAIRYACDEIERLNNIINEFDKVMIEFKKQIEEERKNYREIICNLVGKVRELKGIDEE